MKRNLYALLFIVALWWLLSIAVDPRLIPSPAKVAVVISAKWALIGIHLLYSLGRILAAVFATLLIGVPIGFALARSRRADALLSPIFYALYPVPKIAFLPLIMLFFGLGDFSKVLLVGIIILFQIVISTRDSVKAIEGSYYTSILALGANRRQIYRHMLLPAILPNLLTALRLSTGTAISVLFFAENFATRYGIGYYIMDSWLKLAYAEMFAGIVGIALMGILLFSAIDALDRRLCRWKYIS